MLKINDSEATNRKYIFANCLKTNLKCGSDFFDESIRREINTFVAVIFEILRPTYTSLPVYGIFLAEGFEIFIFISYGSQRKDCNLSIS